MTDNRKKYLWGSKRYVSEMIYVCEDLLGEYEFIPVDKFQDISLVEGVIVICDYDMEDKAEYLNGKGMEYQKDYIMAKDIFLEMDKKEIRFPIRKDRKIVFWGCGENAKKIGRIEDVDFYIDSNEELKVKTFEGKKILHPDEIDDWKSMYIYLAVSIRYFGEIEKFLDKKGLVKGKDYFGNINKAFQYLPSRMMMKTLHDKPMKNFYCEMGMRKVDFSGDGSMHACCGARIAPVIGNLFNNSTVWEEWNSYTAKIVKLSMINKTYSFCSREKCSRLKARESQIEYEEIDYAGADYSNKGEKYPPLATICIDYTCNLKCESCREDYKIASKDELENRSILAAKISNELMPNVDEIIMAGNGEMFYSKLYRDMWINKSGEKRKGIIVKSNGLLFHEKNWKLLEEGYREISLDISIDGASKEVYEEVRRGGKWEVLCKNMKFASELRKTGKIKSFKIEFVVQKKNYMDTQHFVQLGKEWGCDSVIFARIYNWGTYSWEEFNNDITLFENNGTGKIKNQYQDYFKSSVFDDPIVEGIAVFRA